MNEKKDVFEDLGAKIMAISFSPPALCLEHAQDMELWFPIVSDVSQADYTAFGLMRASFVDVWHPKVIAQYVKLLLKGRRPSSYRRGDDLGQLGGDFIIDKKGHIAFEQLSVRADKRPSIDTLLRTLEKLSSQTLSG